MPSIHAHKAIAVAEKLGGFAAHDDALPLWEMSKRELIEIAVRIGALNSGDPDSAAAGIRAALHEAQTLRNSGII